MPELPCWPEPLPDPVIQLLTSHETEPEHVYHVARLALQLFDGMRAHGQVQPEDRPHLAWAALLHDIGWSQTLPDGKGHHKASASLIRSTPWPDLSPHLRERVALVARYHRKACPRPEHEEFQRLPHEEKDRVIRLASLLRVADGLDRRHLRKVDRVSIASDPAGWVIRIEPTAGPDGMDGADVAPEQTAASLKADLLRQWAGPVDWVVCAGTR